jgi:NADPH2:quinone reductase
MHAVVLHEFGPPENLRYEEVEDPKPGPGQVRIAVRAIGVHLLDTTIRKGQPGPLPLPALPFIGGREVAGTVDALGPEVDGGWLGRRVVAYLGMASGGYAELASADVSALHTLDETVDDAVAVAMIGSGRTAIAILETARLTEDDVVVITSAAGGLGALLVQGALAAGAVVVGAVGGPDKVEVVRRLGASLAVDYDQPGWADTVRASLDGRGATAVLDGVGGIRGRAALELLDPGGRILFYGWSSGEPTSLNVFDLVGRGISASAAVGKRLAARPGGLRGFEDQARAALASGQLTPLITRFPLADAAGAHLALENRQTVGKVVLIP